MNKEQVTLALRVLKNMQTCIRNRDTYVPGVGDCHNKDENYRSPFNLSVSFGICWHVYAHTPPDLGLDTNFLKPVFLELGYISDKFPVESTVYPNENELFWNNVSYDLYDLYFKDSEDSKVRCKLVDQLVEYFTDKLETL